MKNKLLFSLSCFALCLLLVGFAVGVHGQALPGTGTLASGSTTPPYATINGTVIGPVFALTAPTLTGWTAENSASLTTSGGYLYIEASRTSATSMRGIYRTAPSAPYTRSYLMNVDVSGGTAGGGEIMWAVGFRQSTTGKIVTGHSGWSGGSPVAQLDNWTSITSVSSTVTNIGGNSMGALAARGTVWFRVQDDNTDLNFYSSIDGVNWLLLFTEARGSFMTSSGGVTGPDQLFLGAYVNSGSARLAVWSMQ